MLLLYFIVWKIFGWKCRSRCISLWNLFQSPVFSTILGALTFFSNLYSTTFSLCSCLNVRHRFHTHYSTGNISFLQILIFILWGKKNKDKRLLAYGSRQIPQFNLLLMSTCKQFLYISLFPNIWFWDTFKESITKIYFVILSCILFTKHNYVLSFLSNDS